jgi:tetratricopeptide (TPR) repeat protein
MNRLQMKKIWVLTLLPLLLLNLQGLACFQHMGEPFVSRYEESKKTFPVPKGHQVEHLEHEGEFWSVYRAEFNRGRYEGSIDYGALLVYRKEFAQAEEIFAKIIQKWPDKYEACANYGTILEVNGKLEEALKWLKKAIEISPNSHEGSEWLHLAIIEDKIANRKTVQGPALTGQDFGEEAEPKPVVSKQATRKLQRDLFYQLNERMTFIEPKDPYIAALLFELGNACLLLDDRKSALKNYEAAQRYGFHSSLLQKRKAFAQSTKPMTFAFPAAPEPDTATPAPAKVAQAPITPAPAAPAQAPERSPGRLIYLLGILVVAIASLVMRMRRRRGKS